MNWKNLSHEDYQALSSTEQAEVFEKILQDPEIVKRLTPDPNDPRAREMAANIMPWGEIKGIDEWPDAEIVTFDD